MSKVPPVREEIVPTRLPVDKLPLIVITSIVVGMPFTVLTPVAIAPLLTLAIIASLLLPVVFVPLVPFRITVLVRADVLSAISAAASRRQQHCQHERGSQ